jgi:hypothetical protein
MMQEKAGREALKTNLKRLLRELKAITSDNSSDMIRNEDVEAVQKQIEEYIHGFDESIKMNIANAQKI